MPSRRILSQRLIFGAIVLIGTSIVVAAAAHQSAAQTSAASSHPKPTQVSVTAPVGLGSAACSGLSQASCDSSPSNQHCLWTGTNCAVSWDLRGDTSSVCSNGLVNRIYDYNTSDTGNFDSVGLRAINNSAVWANNNVWRSADTTQNYTQGTGSFIRAHLICSTIDTCLSN
jgi:hypothetical protein